MKELVRDIEGANPLNPEIWIVTAISCIDCNCIGVASFAHKPSEEEIMSVKNHIGGMTCITTIILKSTVNGDPVEHSIRD